MLFGARSASHGVTRREPRRSTDGVTGESQGRSCHAGTLGPRAEAPSACPSVDRRDERSTSSRIPRAHPPDEIQEPRAAGSPPFSRGSFHFVAAPSTSNGSYFALRASPNLGPRGNGKWPPGAWRHARRRSGIPRPFARKATRARCDRSRAAFSARGRSGAQVGRQIRPRAPRQAIGDAVPKLSILVVYTLTYRRVAATN